jgi:hypothetical protein
VIRQARRGAGDRHDAGHDRHCHGHDVVDEQRRGRDQCGVLAEVIQADRERAATAGIGMTGLAVGQDHDHEQRRDQCGDPLREGQVGRATGREDEHDLLGGVCDRGQRVRREHRQGQPFGQQGLAELMTAQSSPDE